MKYQFETRDTCPACGSPDTVTVYSRRFGEEPVATFIRDYYHIDPAILDSAPYALDRCANCTLTFQKYVGDRDLLVDLYTKWCWQPAEGDALYPGYLEAVSAPLQSAAGHEVMALASFLQRPPERLRILDYGMGWGGWIRIARSLGCEAYGLELSPVQAEFAARHGIHVLTDEDLPGRGFDFIHTEQVFEHVTEPRALLARLAAALAPGGIVKISVPSGERLGPVLAALGKGGFDRDAIMPVQPLEHINTFTRKAIAAMAAAVDLEPVRRTLRNDYAFLGRRGTLAWSKPVQALKELVRPFHTRLNRSNIYLWFRKAG